jgi:multidrug efflux pump subunit AcrA (membrane-fusion protein)
VPLYEDEVKKTDTTGDENKKLVQGYTSVNIPYEKQQLIGVKYGIVEKKDMTRIVRAVGKVSHDTELYNTIQEYFNTLNYYYKMKNSGSPENANSAKVLLDSIIFKLKILGFNENEINKLSQGNDARSLILTEGSGKAWIEASVFESDIVLIKIGQKVVVTAPSIPGKIFPGSIIAIDSVLDTETRTVRTRILIDNTSNLLKHEVYVNVDIQVPMGQRLVVSEDAIINSGLRNIAFVVKDDGYFEPREVVLGEKINDFYEIISGLKENEKVATSANFLIDSESKLKAAVNQM